MTIPKVQVCILSVSCWRYSICKWTRSSWYFWYLFNKIVEIYLNSSNPRVLKPIAILVQYVCGIDWYRSASIFFWADCCLSVFHYYHDQSMQNHLHGHHRMSLSNDYLAMYNLKRCFVSIILYRIRECLSCCRVLLSCLAIAFSCRVLLSV